MTKISSIIILLLTFLCSAATSFAQIQQGVVKTRGKMVNGTHVPGQGLPGAVVSVKGRGKVLVQNENGEFSFSTPDSKFKLDSVSKKGYVLVDFDCVGQELTQSENAVNLVMETPSKLMEDRLAAERKIRRSLQQQLAAKEDELEALKEQNKITVEEYNKLLQELYSQQESNEKLIAQMAEKYSKLDYDQLDDFYRQVADYILAGNLVKADSLLNSRGNLNTAIEKYRELQKLNQNEKDQLDKRLDNFNKSMALQQYQLEDLAKMCYNKFEVCKLRYEKDSAAYYLRIRAALDTTNIQWSVDAGDYLETHMAQYNEAILYYTKALACALGKQDSDKYIALCYSRLGKVHEVKQELDTALVYLNKALELQKEIFGEKSLQVAETYFNMGKVYVGQSKYHDAATRFFEAEDIQMQFMPESVGDVAVTNFHIREDIFGLSGKYEELALHALERYVKYIVEKYGESHIKTAEYYNRLGAIFYERGDKKSGAEYLNKSLSIHLNLLGEKHSALGKCYLNLGRMYLSEESYNMAQKYFTKALNLYKLTFGERHPNIAECYNCFGELFLVQKECDKAREYFNDALDINIECYGKGHFTVLLLYSKIGDVYKFEKDYVTALKFYKLSYDQLKENRELFFKHEYLSLRFNIGDMYYKTGDYIQALGELKEIKPLFRITFGRKHELTIKVKELLSQVKDSKRKSHKGNVR